MYKKTYEELENEKDSNLLDDDFFLYTTDALRMELALARFNIGIVYPETITNSLVHWIELDELLLVTKIIEKTRHIPINWDELLETCVTTWNFKMYETLSQMYFVETNKLGYHLELACDIEFLDVPNITLFYSILTKAKAANFSNLATLYRCFALLLNNNNKHEMLAVFLVYYELNKTQLKEIIQKHEVRDKPMIALILSDYGVLDDLNITEYCMVDKEYIEKNKHWTIEMFTLLIKAEQYDHIEYMVEKCPLVDLKVYIPCMIYLLNKKQWRLLSILNQRVKYEQKTMQYFNECGERTILRGPNYYMQFETIMDKYMNFSKT